MADGSWIAAGIRCPVSGVQPASLNFYLGIYYFNAGSYDMELYKRINGTYTLLGSSASFGATQEPAGTVFRLEGQGTRISWMKNGVAQVSVTDSSLAPGGAPMIAIFHGPAGIDNWEGGNLGAAADIKTGSGWLGL
jgi:hypothetical protein